LHRLLRLSACTARNDLAERCTRFLLGRTAGHDDLPDAAGPEQRISMVARMRLRASVHAGVDGGVIADLCAFAMAIGRAEHAGACSACGNSIFWLDRGELCSPRSAQPKSRGESVLRDDRGVSHAARIRAERNPLLSSLRSLQAR